MVVTIMGTTSTLHPRFIKARPELLLLHFCYFCPLIIQHLHTVGVERSRGCLRGWGQIGFVCISPLLLMHSDRLVWRRKYLFEFVHFPSVFAANQLWWTFVSLLCHFLFSIA